MASKQRILSGLALAVVLLPGAGMQVFAAAPAETPSKPDTGGGNTPVTTTHRDRAVTGSDYRPLAPQTPAAGVSRPQAPTPVASPGSSSKAINPPVLDDRNYRQLRKNMQKRIPRHTPEWTDSHDHDPGASALDPKSGRVRFGDGIPGRRPSPGKSSSGKPSQPAYRTGAGKAKVMPAPPGSKLNPESVKIRLPVRQDDTSAANPADDKKQQ